MKELLLSDIKGKFLIDEKRLRNYSLLDIYEISTRVIRKLNLNKVDHEEYL